MTGRPEPFSSFFFLFNFVTKRRQTETASTHTVACLVEGQISGHMRGERKGKKKKRLVFRLACVLDLCWHVLRKLDTTWKTKPTFNQGPHDHNPHNIFFLFFPFPVSLVLSEDEKPSCSCASVCKKNMRSFTPTGHSS